MSKITGKLHKVGIATFVMRGKPYLTALRAEDSREGGEEDHRQKSAAEGSPRLGHIRNRRGAGAGAGTGTGKSELRQLSKAQLYERATEQNVAGRSRMSREAHRRPRPHRAPPQGERRLTRVPRSMLRHTGGQRIGQARSPDLVEDQ